MGVKSTRKGQKKRVWTVEQKLEIVHPIIDALNGWTKEELYLDFDLETADDPLALLDEYVHYFNYERPAAALGYKSPVQYLTELGL